MHFKAHRLAPAAIVGAALLGATRRKRAGRADDANATTDADGRGTCRATNIAGVCQRCRRNDCGHTRAGCQRPAIIAMHAATGQHW